METWEPVFFQLQGPWNKLFLWVLLKPDFSSQLPREEGRASLLLGSVSQPRHFPFRQAGSSYTVEVSFQVLYLVISSDLVLQCPDGSG